MTNYRLSTQAKQEKVTNMVGTFLNKASVRVKTIKTEPKKVTCTVGTFLNEWTVRVKTTKNELKKVTNTVGTFLNEGQLFWLKNHQLQLW